MVVSTTIDHWQDTETCDEQTGLDSAQNRSRLYDRMAYILFFCGRSAEERGLLLHVYEDAVRLDQEGDAKGAIGEIQRFANMLRDESESEVPSPVTS